MVDKHIKLIVTGEAEKTSLHQSLQKCFPTHTANGDLVIWDEPLKMFGVTNYRLTVGRSPSDSMKKLVDAMFVEALIGKCPTQKPPDLVIVIDDVEIGNVGQETVVVAAFLQAVQQKLNSCNPADRKRIQERIQNCCSLHFLCPMVEAYFFADNATLAASGSSLIPSLCHLTDVEQFDASCDTNSIWQALCRSENTKKAQNGTSWWKTECHPKRYLTHLLSISNAPAYHETTLGAHMIAATNWQTVAKNSTDSPFISALLEDIWDWFKQTPQLGQFQGTSSPITYQVKTKLPSQRLLRNI